jgi:Protein of unknown function (DUF2865)
MHNPHSSSLSRARHALVIAVALGALMALGPFAPAQTTPPSEQPPGTVGPGGSAPPGNPLCQRLEGQLALIDRGSDPAKADQIKRYEDAAAKQQSELDRVTAQAKRMGCDSSGFFSLFTSNSAQCGPVNNQIQQMRGNLDQINNGLAQLRGGANSDRDNQRRSVLTALAQNNCGPQYANAARAAAQGGGFFNELFGGNNPQIGPDMGPPSSTYKTVCVRTCDGFYFPVSPATTPSRFPDDERACKQLCPAADAALYAFRYPGEDINQAVSISGQSYTSMPNAFKYRQEFNPSCSCKAAGQSWADALKQIDERATAAENGDIIVTDENAKKMMQPRDAQGRPIKQPSKGAPPVQNAKTAPGPAQTTAPVTAPAAKDGSDKPIRTVGPTFIPAK